MSASMTAACSPLELPLTGLTKTADVCCRKKKNDNSSTSLLVSSLAALKIFFINLKRRMQPIHSSRPLALLSIYKFVNTT